METSYKPFELAINSLGFYVDRLLYAMIKKQNKILEESPLNLQHADFVVLKVINYLGSASQSQLASVMGKERSGIGRIVALLEKKGYVKREPLNGSTNIVTPTEKGRAAVPLIAEISDRLTEEAFSGFTQRNRELTLKFLDKLYKNVLEEK